MNKIDTHQHLFAIDRFRYDWTADFPPLAGKPLGLAEYQAAARETGITESIFMEVDVPEDQSVAEAAYVCSLAENPDNRISGVIAACRPENADLAAQIEAVAHPRLVGFRRVLHTQPDALSTTATFRENVARMGQEGYSFDICVHSGQHVQAMQLADACPDTRLILDHCGIPAIASGELDAWRAGILELSLRPQLVCKLSGIIAYTSGEVTADTLRPVVEHVLDCFGWDRVVWGSDWPVCNLTADLRTWVRLLDEILSGCSDDERARLYERNAREVYRLPLRG